MEIDFEHLLGNYYKSRGVSVEDAKKALLVRLETLNCYKGEDGWEPEYSDRMDNERFKTINGDDIIATVLGQHMYDNMIKYVRNRL